MRAFIFLLFMLAGCGGGGNSTIVDSSSSTTAYSGVAIDGYLSKATVCLDLNDNGSCDVNEPTTTTDSNGSYTLYGTIDQFNNHSIIGKAVAGITVDLDSPNTPVTSDMTLTVPVGRPSVLSPLTTLVQAKVQSGQTLSASITSVQTELGLTSIDPMKNYVAEETTNSDYLNAHKVAASIAEVLKSIDTNSDQSTTLAEKMSSLRGSVSSQIIPNIAIIKSATSVSQAASSSKAIINDIPKILYADVYGTGIMAGLGKLQTGDIAHIIFAFDKLMYVSGGTPTLTLSSGGTATYSSGSGLNTYGSGSTKGTLIFDYTVGSSDSSTKLSIEALNLNGAKILNSNSNAAKSSSYKTNLSVGTLRINNFQLTSPSRIVAFGDYFSTVDSNGYASYSVNTSETNATIASRIAATYGFTLKYRQSSFSAIPFGTAYSYATGTATASDTATQISSYLVNNTPDSDDLFIITAGTQDIVSAAPTNNTTSIAAAATALSNAIQALTNAGAKYVLVMQPINVARTPPFLEANGVRPAGAYASYKSNAQSLSYDSGTNCQSFSCQLTTKLNAAYPANSSRQPVLLADLLPYFNLITGTTNTGSTNTFASYGVANPDLVVCNSSVPNCTTSTLSTTSTNQYTSTSWDYSNSVFAYDYYTTPFVNRLLADYIYSYNFYRAGWR